MPSIEIALRNRHVSVLTDGTPIVLEEKTTLAYRCVQLGVNAALKAIASHYNLGSSVNVVRKVGPNNVRFVGPTRELAVARLHLHVAFGVSEEELSAIVFQSEVSGLSIYESFGFDNDHRAITTIAHLLNEWQSILRGDEATRWIVPRSQLRRDLGIEDDKIRPAKIGIVGVTGAGKSSFLNALLGRIILPVAAEISTATVIELRYADSAQREHLVIQWMQSKMLDTRIGKLRAGAKTLLSQEENQERIHRLELLEKVRRERDRGPIQRRINELGSLATASADSVAHGIERIVVYLHHPLLQHLTLFDTPGLRDPDPWRARIAIDAVSGLDAWAYLQQASDKQNGNVIEDRKMLGEQANNAASTVILTKIDSLGNLAEEVLAIRRRELRDGGLLGEVAACTARGPSELLACESLQAIVRRCKQNGFINYTSHVVDPQPQNGWEDVEDALRGLRDESYQAALHDYLFDASGIPASARLLGQTLAKEGLALRAKTVRDGFTRHVHATHRRLMEAVSAAENLIAKCSSRDKLKESMATIASRRHSLGQEIDDRRQRYSVEHGQLWADCKERVSSLQRVHADTQAYAMRRLRQHVESTAKFELYGSRAFDLFSAYDEPLARMASQEIEKFAKSCLKRISPHVDEPASLAQAINAQLTQYSLHDKDAFVVADYERFFESYGTMLERMERAARIHCEEANETIRSRTHDRICKIINVVREHVEGTLSSREHQLKDLYSQHADLKNALATLEHDAPSAREAYEQRLKASLEALAPVETFIKRLMTIEKSSVTHV